MNFTVSLKIILRADEGEVVVRLPDIGIDLDGSFKVGFGIHYAT